MIRPPSRHTPGARTGHSYKRNSTPAPLPPAPELTPSSRHRCHIRHRILPTTPPATPPGRRQTSSLAAPRILQPRGPDSHRRFGRRRHGRLNRRSRTRSPALRQTGSETSRLQQPHCAEHLDLAGGVARPQQPLAERAFLRRRIAPWQLPLHLLARQDLLQQRLDRRLAIEDIKVRQINGRPRASGARRGGPRGRNVCTVCNGCNGCNVCNSSNPRLPRCRPDKLYMDIAVPLRTGAARAVSFNLMIQSLNRTFELHNRLIRRIR